MDDRNTGFAQGIGSSDIGAFADSLAESLDRQMKVAFEPEERKSLRRFSSTEVAELLRVSTSNLRNRHKDGSFPEVHTDGRGHRFYTAEDVDELRNILARTGKNADAYRPGRREGDRLQVISVVNFKGGSSKTTATIHLANRYALRGYRVLVLDLDPQASLTTFFGFRPELEFAEGGTIYDALRYEDQVPLSEVIQKTYFHKLDMVPAGLMLSEYETETANALARRVQPIFAERLALALEEVDSDYDIVLIDCQPSLGLLTVNALTASSDVIIPMETEYFALRGVALLQDTIDKVMGRLNPDLRILGVLATMYDPRTLHSREVLETVTKAYGDQVFSTVINRTVKFPDAAVAGEPITSFASSSSGAEAYRRLAREVLAR